ncbi:hypothetical protein COU49_02640 [Candidatus Nomurabacteria bacterium CG10_big_fil_rev_8_21_14_0_10_35_16]|uniref:Uncharacterized protein n=1 Tax=Candidatus Nomurabacteria bacterium CG10_big_fil_rev_8_21_14_0_10_35_16 TaxID=1974731 RepID=A0A2H0TB19_9BACT|nr:MAG: hypothetical protein COU49_02640 [Candidatus Nomurabacteria bacterium CG10_big_fil_rev_8_21_14_0_10_35_16]
MKFEFFKHKPSQPTQKPLPSEELKSPEIKKAKRIIAGIIDINNIDDDTQKTINSIEASGTNVDYYASTKIYRENNMKNAGTYTYVVSAIDGTDKFSHEYLNCTGIVIVGTNKQGEEISFMTHQEPSIILVKKRNNFTTDLRDRLREFIEKVEKGSIDAVMFGGNRRRASIDFQDSIELVTEILKQELGFEPTIMTGPNLSGTQTDIFFDTKNRRLYIVRGAHKNEHNYKTNESFLPSEIDEQVKNWFN